MARMKVLYLIDSLASGGAQRQLVTLLSALDRRRVVPHVAVYHPLDHFRSEVVGLGVPIHTLGMRGAKDPRVLVMLTRLLRRESFDVLHSFLRTPGVLARIATLGCSSTRVVVSHRSVDLGHSRIRLLLERLLASRADAFVANAEAVCSRLEELVPAARGRVRVVHNGVGWTQPSQQMLDEGSQMRKEWTDGDTRLLLGVVGRVVAPKDPHLLLDALLRLPEETLRGLSVVWAGAWTDLELVESVRRRLGSLPFGSRVRMLGEIRAIRSFYLAIDCLVHPSRWEGFPNAVLEALAHQTPVIAPDVGDVRAIIEDGATGWVVPANDAGSLAAAIHDLAILPAERRAEIGKRGSRDVLRRYPADRLAHLTMDVYRAVLDRDEESRDAADSARG